MGVKRYSTLTPYIKVTKTIERPKVTVKRICPNHPTTDQKNNKFCSQCGSEVQNKDVNSVEKLTAKQVLWRHPDFEDDRMFSPEYCDVLIPNKYPPNPFKINHNSDSAINLLDSIHEITTQMEWFEKEYAKEINILREAFGTVHVEICWGLVNYWS